jgi:hypothetical protein
MEKSDVQLLASGLVLPGQRTNVGDCEGDCVGDCEGVDVVGVAVGAGVGGGGDDDDLPLTCLTSVCSSSTSRLPHRCSGSCLPSPLRAGAATTAPTHVTAAATRTMGSETTLIRQSVILGSEKKPKRTSWCRRRFVVCQQKAGKRVCSAVVMRWCHVRINVREVSIVRASRCRSPLLACRCVHTCYPQGRRHTRHGDNGESCGGVCGVRMFCIQHAVIASLRC